MHQEDVNLGKLGTKRGGVLFLAAAGGVGRQAKRPPGLIFGAAEGLAGRQKDHPGLNFDPKKGVAWLAKGGGSPSGKNGELPP